MELFNKSFTKVVNLKVFFINPGKVLPKLSASSKENKAVSTPIPFNEMSSIKPFTYSGKLSFRLFSLSVTKAVKLGSQPKYFARSFIRLLSAPVVKASSATRVSLSFSLM